MFDRLPPQNLEAERGVLGSILLDPDTFDDAAEVLGAEDFYRDNHQKLFRGMLAVKDAGIPVDPVTLVEQLARTGELESIGGHAAIRDLVDATPHAANARYYADIVKQKSIGRTLIQVHTDGLNECYANQHTAAELLERSERRVLAVADAEAVGDTVRIDAVMPHVMASIARRAAGEVTGISTGLEDLDGVTTGFQPGNLIYLAGRTSMGKTSLALNIIDHLSVNLERPVLLVSLEMSRAEIGERLLATRSEVDGQRLRSGHVSERHRQALALADDAIRTAPIFIDDTPGRTASQIAANARRHRQREGIELVVVDLINHVEGEDRNMNRREQMCVISRRFKGLARELSIPVLVLAQLNRGPDNREGNRPRKSDLKECGNLEEDADLVLLLHRPEYYDPNDLPGQAVVIVDKNRNGPTRDVQVVFTKHLMRFDSLAREQQFVPPAAAGF